MPLLVINVKIPEQQAYLEWYKQEHGLQYLKDRMWTIWNHVSADDPWVEVLNTMRAVQAFTYLVDPNGDANIDRYNLIVAGRTEQPFYGSTNIEVANAYVDDAKNFMGSYNSLINDYWRRRQHVMESQDMVAVDVVVQQFIDSTEWLLN